jgi:hypothetical protein
MFRRLTIRPDAKSKCMFFRNINIKQEQPTTGMTCRGHFHAGYFSG